MKNRLALRIFFVTLVTTPLLKAILEDKYPDPNIPLDQKTLIEQKRRRAAQSKNSVKNPVPANLEKQDESEPETETNAESKEQDKTTEKKDSSILEFHGILPESVVQGPTNAFEDSQDQTTQGQLENTGDEIKGNKLSTLFGISFDKKQLMYYGAGAVAIVVFCGVTYVLHKNGTLKKIGDYIGNYIVEHKFEVKAAVGTACIFALAGIYAKQQGITMQDTSNWITSFWNY